MKGARIELFNKVNTSNHDQQIVAGRSRRLDFLDVCHNTSQLHCIRLGLSQVTRYSPCHHLGAGMLWVLEVQPSLECLIVTMSFSGHLASFQILDVTNRILRAKSESSGRNHRVQHILVSVSQSIRDHK